VETSEGARETMALRPMTVAAFYQELMAALDGLGVPVKIWEMPCEVAEPIAFDRDVEHHAYDGEYAQRFWRYCCKQRGCSRVSGAVSRQGEPSAPVLGAMDLACTRFRAARRRNTPACRAA